MPDFDYEAAKGEIAKIVAIAKTCPELLQAKCFELLFHVVFDAQVSTKSAPATPAPVAHAEATPPVQSGETPLPQQTKKLPPNVLAFARVSKTWWAYSG